MKKSELKIEANKFINDIFKKVLDSDNKEVWKKAIDFILNQVDIQEKTCWDKKFMYREVRTIMTNKYAIKFNIKK